MDGSRLFSGWMLSLLDSRWCQSFEGVWPSNSVWTYYR